MAARSRRNTRPKLVMFNDRKRSDASADHEDSMAAERVERPSGPETAQAEHSGRVRLEAVVQMFQATGSYRTLRKALHKGRNPTLASCANSCATGR